MNQNWTQPMYWHKTNWITYIYTMECWGHKKSSGVAGRKLVICSKGVYRDTFRITYSGLL